MCDYIRGKGGREKVVYMLNKIAIIVNGSCYSYNWLYISMPLTVFITALKAAYSLAESLFFLIRLGLYFKPKF
jgi:hypothetical protein